MSQADHDLPAQAPRKKKKVRAAKVTTVIHQDCLGGVDMTQRRNLELSQWFTDPGLAKRIAYLTVDVAERVRPAGAEGLCLLEPSAGDGALIAPLLTYSGVRVRAVELDPTHVETLRARFQDLPEADIEDFRVRVHEGNFLIMHMPIIFDGCPMNPPYENGFDGLFVQRVMQVCRSFVALVRTVSMHGIDRYRQVWKDFAPDGPWVLEREVTLVLRPDFCDNTMLDTTFGAKSDFTILVGRRRLPSDPPVMPTIREWWT